jgi:hypothetical protein
MKTRTGFTLCLALTLVLASPPSAAAPAYQVEMIVFAWTNPDADGERWPEDPGLPQRDGLALLGAAGADGMATVTPLPPSRFRLGGVAGVMTRNARYRPLLHVSWLHPESGRVRGVFVSRPGAGDAGEGAGLLGSVRLRAGRFLHADVDMAYFPAGPVTPEAAPPVGHVRLQESRRIRLNEVHYFDHPLFGVVMQVSRADGGDEPADASTP